MPLENRKTTAYISQFVWCRLQASNDSVKRFAKRFSRKCKQDVVLNQPTSRRRVKRNGSAVLASWSMVLQQQKTKR
jgi:hypothetical protein